tara:strand:+ start:243 stop:488 length:246 start_codon:yes stop_codon:yes gene_type:complete
MTPEDLKKHSNIIDESVSFIEKKTEDIWNRYEEIGDCFTNECEKEKQNLRTEMDTYLDKLKKEEKMIDQYEEILHNTTGTQ